MRKDLDDFWKVEILCGLEIVWAQTFFQLKDRKVPQFEFSWRKNEEEDLSESVNKLKVSESTESLPGLE